MQPTHSDREDPDSEAHTGIYGYVVSGRGLRQTSSGMRFDEPD